MALQTDLRLDTAATLARAEKVLHWGGDPEPAPLSQSPQGELKTGVDLGTAYLVLIVLDKDGLPIVGEYEFAQVVRDGLVVDFVGAVDRLSAMKKRVEKRLGRELEHAASSFPPGVPRVEVQATANVVEAAGIDCSELIDEPTAANALLGIQNGAIVDVGGGTTGIAIIEEGKVVYVADEATGGTHFSLVIAGANNISFEEAEVMKIDPGQHQRLFPVVRPVMEKVANIASRHIGAYENDGARKVEQITLVGGTASFAGIADVISEYSGIHTQVPQRPLFVTPLGIALQDKEKALV